MKILSKTGYSVIQFLSTGCLFKEKARRRGSFQRHTIHLNLRQVSVKPGETGMGGGGGGGGKGAADGR